MAYEWDASKHRRVFLTKFIAAWTVAILILTVPVVFALDTTIH